MHARTHTHTNTHTQTNTRTHSRRYFLEDFNDKMFYNMFGMENDEDARSKQLGEDYAGVFFAKDAAQRVRTCQGCYVDAGSGTKFGLSP